MEAQLKLVGLDEIEINEGNPRQRTDEGRLKELATSIKSVGVIQPVVITTRDGRNLLVTGERRVRAARMAGLEEIPAVVKDLTDKEILEAMLVENLQREDLAPLEEAEGLNRLVKEYGWKQKELAEHIGRSQPWISKRIRLLILPQEAREALYSGRISTDNAIELCRLRKFPDKILQTMDEPGWNMKAKVDRALIEAQREMAQENKFAQLEAEGKRIWRGSFTTWFDVGSRQQAFKLNKSQEKEHEKENRKCLAYTARWWDDSIVAVCTDPEHWKKEMHRWETEQHETEKEERKAKEQAKLESDYEVMHSITGAVQEIEGLMRRQALYAASRQKTQKTAARAFGWKVGRRFDTARLSEEIRKARGRELRRLWLVALACEQISYGWLKSEVLEMIRQTRVEAAKDG